VESTEIAEAIHHGHHGAQSAEREERFSRLTAIYVGVIAMLLAITSLGGESATKEMLSANIQSADTYAFYQAKNIRQTAYQIAADQFEVRLAEAGLTEEAKVKAQQAIARYRETAARYESDPEKGEGKKELIARAKGWEAKRDHAAEQIPNFEFAGALFQIAIVLGSVSIVAVSRALRNLSAVLAAVAVLLMLNGYFLLVPLPIE